MLQQPFGLGKAQCAWAAAKAVAAAPAPRAWAALLAASRCRNHRSRNGRHAGSGRRFFVPGQQVAADFAFAHNAAAFHAAGSGARAAHALFACLFVTCGQAFASCQGVLLVALLALLAEFAAACSGGFMLGSGLIALARAAFAGCSRVLRKSGSGCAQCAQNQCRAESCACVHAMSPLNLYQPRPHCHGPMPRRACSRNPCTGCLQVKPDHAKHLAGHYAKQGGFCGSIFASKRKPR